MAKAVSFKLDADMKSMMKGFQDMLRGIEANNAKLVTLTKQIKNASNRLDETGSKGKNAFSGIASEMGSMLARFISVSAAIGGVVRLISSVRDESKQAAERVKELYDASAQFAQISMNQEGLKKNLLISELASIQHGVGREESRALTYQAGSIGMADVESVSTAASVARIGASPSEIMRAVGKYRATFGEDVGDVRHLISAFGAAGRPSDIRMDEMAQAAIRSAQEIKALGGTAAESLAIPSVLSQQFANPEMAGSSIAALAAIVNKAGYGGAGLMEGLAKWKAEAPEEYAESVMSERSAARAATAIETSQDTIWRRTQEVEHARVTGDIYEQMIDVSKSPELTPQLQLRQMQVAKELQQYKPSEIQYQLAQAAEDYWLNEAGVAPLSRKLQEGLRTAQRWMFGSEAAAERIVNNRWHGMGIDSQSSATRLAQTAIDDMNEKIIAELKDINRNTTGGPELSPRGSVGAEMRPRE